MSIMAKECLVGYFDEAGDYCEAELKQNRTYMFTIMGKLESTDDGTLILDIRNSDENIQVDVADICGIKEV